MFSVNNLSAREFVQKVLIEDTKKLIDEKLFHFAFIIMAQGLEILGSFLDSKPLKAKEQSKLRFSHAVNRLMPNEYSKLNNNHKLYNQLRASLAHTFTVSRELYLTSKSEKLVEKEHLKEMEGKLIIVAEYFYNDFKKACLRLLEGMEKGLISEKKINMEFYYTFKI